MQVNGHQIEEVVTFKYLGVWISSDLSILKLHAPKPDDFLDTCTECLHHIANQISFFIQIPSPPHLKLRFSHLGATLEDKLLLEAIQVQATRMASKQYGKKTVCH